MKKAFVLVPSLIAFVALAGCADEDTATTDTEHGGSTVDASADSTSSSEAATDNDASSQEDVSTSADGSQVDGAQGDESQGDGSTAEGGGDGDAGSTLPDSGSREAGPGGDGGLVIGGDSAASDATFQIKGPSGTNLLSSSDVNADCTGVAGATAGVYVVTCTEKTGSTGPCRTVTITLGTNASTGLTSGLTLTAVNKTTPAVGEASVVYQESIDCTSANTNGWTVASPGGTVVVDTRGDTGMTFTVNNVLLGPSSTAGVWNVNAAGTFTLSGNGRSSLPFD